MTNQTSLERETPHFLKQYCIIAANPTKPLLWQGRSRVCLDIRAAFETLTSHCPPGAFVDRLRRPGWQAMPRVAPLPLLETHWLVHSLPLGMGLEMRGGRAFADKPWLLHDSCFACGSRGAARNAPGAHSLAPPRGVGSSARPGQFIGASAWSKLECCSERCQRVEPP